MECARTHRVRITLYFALRVPYGVRRQRSTCLSKSVCLSRTDLRYLQPLLPDSRVCSVRRRFNLQVVVVVHPLRGAVGGRLFPQ